MDFSQWGGSSRQDQAKFMESKHKMRGSLSDSDMFKHSTDILNHETPQERHATERMHPINEQQFECLGECSSSVCVFSAVEVQP